MSTAIAKILISFDEYVRLKEIEKKYDELKAEQKGIYLARVSCLLCVRNTCKCQFSEYFGSFS